MTERLRRFEAIDNFRDVGDYAGVAGRHVRPGRLFRSAHQARPDSNSVIFLGNSLLQQGKGQEAERLLAETGWLPEPLRMVDRDADIAMDAGVNTEADDLPEFLAGDGEDEDATEDEEQPMVAAE